MLRSAIPVNVFPVSFVVISQRSSNAWTQRSSKRSPDSALSFLQPRAMNES
jgi:hypothetical protein